MIAADRGDADARRNLRAGPAATADPARRGRTRAARGLRQRGESVSRAARWRASARSACAWRLAPSRHRLFQMLLVESLLLALASGALGLLIANWVLRAVPAVLTASLPGVSDVSLDVRVVSFTMGAVDRDGAVLRPGADDRRHEARADRCAARRRASGRRPAAASPAGRAGRRQRGARVRAARRVGPVDQELQQPDERGIGHPRAQRLELEVSLPHAGYNQAPRVRSFYQTVQERITAIPGVKAGVVTTDLPLRADGERRAFSPEGADPRRAARRASH